MVVGGGGGKSGGGGSAMGVGCLQPLKTALHIIELKGSKST